MKRLLILASLVLALGSVANAGQAACRFEHPIGFVCFAEETVLSVYNFEVATGAEISYRDDFHLTPYAAIAWYDNSWFAILETRIPTAVNPFTAKFQLALTIGVLW